MDDNELWVIIVTNYPICFSIPHVYIYIYTRVTIYIYVGYYGY